MQENAKKRSIGTKGKITSSSNIDDNNIKNVVEYEDLSDDQDTQVKRIKVNDKSVPSSDTTEKLSKDNNTLPADFFDNSSKTSSSQQEKTTNEKLSKDNSTLPADFFENSSKISSSQQEKTTNEIEEEWILFQKLISKETQVSNQIAYEDEEELQRDRDEMLDREQEMCFKRSERLKEVAKKVRENREHKMAVLLYDIQNIFDIQDYLCYY
ncbi:7468_t:CDS:2 [Dentiscutata erythropus]|uniref:7468_t:CDS:1 n=1 Tax=Dentiscutata erythropus TaxID=1348616 RepID=A0A9N9ESM6_9GLOM|nr:7468_t:CDS:2 [Dentiscutata erythropus]